MFMRNGSYPIPAFAHASYADNSAKKTTNDVEGFTRNSSETDDFGSFETARSTQDRARRTTPPKKKSSRGTVTLEIPGKKVAIAAAAVIGVIFFIIILASLMLSGSKDITYEDNAFATYQDIDGTYRVAMNGKTERTAFDREVILTPAKDNSFAYVIADMGEAKNVYIYNNSRLKLLCEGVDEILALSDYEIGVVYKLEDRVEYYFEDSLTSLTGRDDPDPQNIVISPDGSTIAYTLKNSNDASINDLYVYNSENSSPKALSSGKVSTVPVSVSDKGEHMVVYRQNGDNKELYLITDNDSLKISDVEGAFDSLIYQNFDATEIVFTTKYLNEYRTYVYDCTKIKKDVTSAHLISRGYAVPQFTNKEIQAPETFEKCYFKDVTSSLTIYLNKKFEAIKISDYLGEIDPDGRYLYIINEQRGNMLIQIELLGERFSKVNGNAVPIANEVSEFVITQKGNLYYTDDHDDVYYYKLAKEKPTRIKKDVGDIMFYSYSNVLYMEQETADEKNEIYVTSEGSDPEKIKFGKTELTELPTLSAPHSKKTYAYYHDETNDNYMLFYTANGSSFKLVSECENINSNYKSEIQKLVDEVLS